MTELDTYKLLVSLFLDKFGEQEFRFDHVPRFAKLPSPEIIVEDIGIEPENGIYRKLRVSRKAA